MNSQRIFYFAGAVLSFSAPFLLFYFTRSNSLGFADAGEFALVTKIAGIAHPPGFPSYVLIGWLWGKFFALFCNDHIFNMVLFSIASVSAASLLLYLTLLKIFSAVYALDSYENRFNPLLSITAALSFCSGYTVWHWANSVEVYGFHIFSMALTFYGLISFNLSRKKKFLFAAASGLSLALASHHLTMIIFLPFIPLFFKENFLTPDVKKRKTGQKPLSYLSVITSRNFITLVVLTVALTSAFYIWMMIHAGQEISYKFGSPDNFSRFIYHIAGGAWQKTTAQSVEGLVSLRFPYFAELVWTQLFLFFPFFIAGIYELFRKRQVAFSWMIILYFLILFVYQLRIDQTSDTDAYMLLPFFVMSFAVAFGLKAVLSRFPALVPVMPAIAAIQILIHFPLSQKKEFNVSESLMAELSRSAPQNSVLLISDWTLVSLFNYFSIGEKFRNDLVVLNYDLKFANWTILPLMYPELYSFIRKEYDHYVMTLGKNHPQEIYNTGCTLDTPELMNAFLNTISKIQDYCRVNDLNFMADPKAYLFLKQYNHEGSLAYMSGFLVASKKSVTNKSFITLPFQWLQSPKLLREPAVSDKLVDFEAALDFSRNYFIHAGDTISAATAEKSYLQIKELQRKLKKKMPFVYRK